MKQLDSLPYEHIFILTLDLVQNTAVPQYKLTEHKV